MDILILVPIALFVFGIVVSVATSSIGIDLLAQNQKK
jgi:hypothetical protein